MYIVIETRTGLIKSGHTLWKNAVHSRDSYNNVEGKNTHRIVSAKNHSGRG